MRTGARGAGRAAAAVLLVLPLLAGAPAPASPAGTRTFKTWSAYCDNGARCVLFGMAADPADVGALKLAREAGPESPVAASLVGLGEEIGETIAVRVDGAPRALRLGPYRVTGSLDEPRRVRLPAADLRPLLPALRDGRTLVLESGKTARAIPLAGAAAAMLWIDDRQGRVGTATAWVRPGLKPASAVPPAPALPLVVPGGSATLIKGRAPAAVLASKAVEDCAEQERRHLDLQEGWRLGAGLQLWLVECQSGAYNENRLVLLSDAHGVRPATLPPAPGDTAPGDTITNGGFSPTTLSLTSFAKGRGPGDCGDEREYLWDGRGFVLKAAKGLGQCQGVPPDDWPTLWRSRSR